MRRFVLLLAPLALAACTATAAGTVTPGSSAAPSTSPSGTAASTAPSTPSSALPSGTSAAVFTSATLKIDGAAVALDPVGEVAQGDMLGRTIWNVVIGRAAGTKVAFDKHLLVMQLGGKKPLEGADAVEGSVSYAIYTTGQPTMWQYNGMAKPDVKPDSQTITQAGGKVDLSYAGTLGCFACPADAPKELKFEAEVKGLVLP